MGAVYWLISTVIELFVWALIASVVLTWLVNFNVVNTRNQVVNQIGTFLYRLTEPALRPLRRFIPNLGGIDITPVVLILLLFFLQRLLGEAMMPVHGM